MKKIFSLGMLLCFLSGFSQTILATHYLNLQKPKDNQQFLTFANNRNKEIFVAAADKKTQTIFRYNSSIFFKDSLFTTTPDASYAIAGYSFDESGNPDLYWTSEDFKKVLSAHYDFAAKTISAVPFDLDLKNENIVSTFSENNTFYLVTSGKKQANLNLYLFKNGKMQLEDLDFSSFEFKSTSNKTLTFNSIIENDPIEKINSTALNPLLVGSRKSKLFVTEHKMLLTLNYNASKTQLFEIDLSTFAITEKTIPQPKLKETGSSNSYFHEGKLYQINLNENEMAVSAQGLNAGDSIKSYHVSENDTIKFRNSPFMVVTNQHKNNDLKSTKKFLRRLSNSEIGLTVYKTPEDYLVTIGGVRDVATTGGTIVGVGVAVGAVLAGYSPTDFGGLMSETMQSIYFEGLFDENFEHKNLEQQRLADDYIGQFLQEHDDILYQNIFFYNDFYVLSYYDAQSKQFVLRKFYDDASK